MKQKEYPFNNDYLLVEYDEKTSYKKLIRSLLKLKKKTSYDIKIGIKFHGQTLFHDDEINESNHLYEILNVINKEPGKVMFEYIYDKIYESIIDNLRINNYCDFQDNRCIANRLNKTKHDINGCCYISKTGLCKRLGEDKCTIKNLACTLFMCSYLRKKGIKFKCDDVLIAKYFLTRKEKKILEYSFFIPKEEVIAKLINK